MRFMSLKVNVQSLGRIELQKLIAATVIPRFAANLVVWRPERMINIRVGQ